MTFDESIEIDAGPAELFDLSQDYDHRLEWDPFLRSASLVVPARPGWASGPSACRGAAGRWRPSTSRSTRRGRPRSR